MTARLLLALLLLAGKIFSQPYWEELTPLRDIEYTTGIHFPSNDRGYIAGKQGTILRTDNSGASWYKLRIPFNLSTNLYDVYFLNRDTGFFGGSPGYRTLNGCQTYTAFPSSLGYIQDICFTSQLTGYLAGSNGNVYKTINTGNTWTTLTTGTTAQLNGIHFANKDTGLAVGNNGTVIRTLDAGATWTSISFTTYFLRSVRFTNDTTAFAVGDYGCMFVSHDAGATWTAVNTGIAVTNFTFNKIRFTKTGIGYAVGSSDHITFTADGGQTWTGSSLTGYTDDFNALGFRPDGTAFIGGKGKVWQTQDYTGWQFNVTGAPFSSMSDVYFTNADTGFACGYGGEFGNTDQALIRTTSKGKTWSVRTSGSDVNSYGPHCLGFKTPTQGFSLAYSTNALSTVNDGYSWTLLTSHSGVAASNDFVFFNASTGYGCSGGVQITTNGGATWTNTVITGAPLLKALSFRNPSLGYVCGLTGHVYKTTDACVTWTNVSPATGYDLSTIVFPTDSVGYTTGPLSGTYKTLNAGATWTTLPAPAYTVKMVFPSKDTGYFLTQAAALYKTVDGGQTFSNVLPSMNNAMVKNGRIFNNAFYAVGQSGTVLRHVMGCTDMPHLTSAISGITTACVNNTDTFSLPLIGGVNYQWDYSYGAQVTPIAPGNKAKVQWSFPGTFFVKASVNNACGSSETVMIQVTVSASPAAPVVAQSGSLLVCSNYTTGLQWFLNGSPLAGAVNDTLVVVQGGTYQVAYGDPADCGSISPGVSVYFTGIENKAAGDEITLFPNPTPKNLTVRAAVGLQRISICDLAGRKLDDYTVEQGAKSYSMALDIPAGTYFITVVTADTSRTFKLVKTD